MPQAGLPDLLMPGKENYYLGLRPCSKPGQLGVYGPGGPVFLAHAMQRVSYIVDLTVLRLAFFMGYE